MCNINHSENNTEIRKFIIPVGNRRSKYWWEFWKTKESNGEIAIKELMSKYSEEIDYSNFFLPIKPNEDKINWNIVGDNREHIIFKIPIGGLSAQDAEKFITKLTKNFNYDDLSDV